MVKNNVQPIKCKQKDLNRTHLYYTKDYKMIFKFVYAEKSNIVCFKVVHLFVYLLYQNQNIVCNLFMELTFCGKGEMEE